MALLPKKSLTLQAIMAYYHADGKGTNIGQAQTLKCFTGSPSVKASHGLNSESEWEDTVKLHGRRRGYRERWKIGLFGQLTSIYT